MYTPKYFSIKELVPKHMYEQFGDRCWELLDERALITLDSLREKFGKMTVNSWSWGGPRNWSGLRTLEYYQTGSAYNESRSQHKYGRAFDVIFNDISPADVRKYVVGHPTEFPFINFLEIEITWFHFDVRNCDRIKLWSPKTNQFMDTQTFLNKGGL